MFFAKSGFALSVLGFTCAVFACSSESSQPAGEETSVAPTGPSGSGDSNEPSGSPPDGTQQNAEDGGHVVVDAGKDASTSKRDAAADANVPVCNTLVPPYPGPVLKIKPGPAAPATGGTIPDGTYDATAANVYSPRLGGAGQTSQIHPLVISVAGNGYEDAWWPGQSYARHSATMTVSGTSLALAPTCADLTNAYFPTTLPFSVNGNELRVYYTNLPGWSSSEILEMVFTKRP